MPVTFEEQGELIWKHLGTILRSADLDDADPAGRVVTDRRVALKTLDY